VVGYQVIWKLHTGASIDILLLINFLQPSFRLADPICTFLFSGLVLATTIGLTRDAVHVLMEGVPRNLEYSDVKRDLKAINGVQSVHSLNVWSLTLDKNAVAVHIAIGIGIKCFIYFFIYHEKILNFLKQERWRMLKRCL